LAVWSDPVASRVRQPLLAVWAGSFTARPGPMLGQVVVENDQNVTLLGRPPVNESVQQALTVDAALRGVRLDEYLEDCFPQLHRVDLRRAIQRGQVRVNGMVETRRVRLREGDYVQVQLAQVRPRPAPAAGQSAGCLEVLFESESALVLAKPAGLPTVPDRLRSAASVHAELERLRPGADLRIVHRLDRDTSGCLLLAKGLEAARHYGDLFEQGLVEKEYVALVHGAMVGGGEVRIEAYLGPDRRRPGKVVASSKPQRGFRAARTDVALEEAFHRHTLVRLRPHTGRGHQLRVHLAGKGHPIVADRDYGGRVLLLSELKPGYKSRPGTVERPLLERQFLHARRLTCQAPDSDRVAVEAPLPSDLQICLDKLRRFDARPQTSAGAR
jgi:RluA family pseudouridine synthase